MLWNSRGVVKNEMEFQRGSEKWDGIPGGMTSENGVIIVEDNGIPGGGVLKSKPGLSKLNWLWSRID